MVDTPKHRLKREFDSEDACFVMLCGSSAWQEEQDRRSFLLCKAVECLACNGKEGAAVFKRCENTVKWWQRAYLFLLLTPEKNCSTIGMYHRFWCIARGSTNGSCAQDPTEFHALRKPRTSPRPQECSSCSVRERKTFVRKT